MVTDINIMFCRHLLSSAVETLKLHCPDVRAMKDAWVWCAGRDHWEFHGPALKDGDAQKYYWHGSASNAYEARYKGWMAWLAAKGIDLDAE